MKATPLVLAAFLVVSMAAHAGESPDRISVMRVPGASKIIKALTGSDGTIHLLTDSADGPKYFFSNDSGATFSAAMPVIDAGSRKPGLEFHGEDIAVGKGGSVHIVSSSNAWILKLPKEQWGFYYSNLAPGAKAFSPMRNLNQKPSEGFSLAADERGNVTANFLMGKLYTMVSHDNGATFSPGAELNPAWDPCNCCTTATTYGADGKMAMLYREKTSNERDMYMVLWDEKSTQPTRTRVSGAGWTINACPMTYYTVTPTPTGYLAAWPTKGQVYFSWLDKNGVVQPPGEIKTPGTIGMRTHVLALSASDGATLIGWKESKEVLGWQLYDAKGQPQGSPGSAPSPGNGAAGVVLMDGRFALFP